MSNAPTTGGGVQTVASGPSLPAEHRRRLQHPDGIDNGEFRDYMLAHQEFSPSTAMQGVASYVRTVPYEDPGRPMSLLGRSLIPALVASQLWVGSTLAADAVEQADALAWLQKIAQAARELNYRGTFVYQHGDHAETSRITHLVDRSGEQEKLETLDGPRREIIRNNAEIITYYADKRLVKREKRLRASSSPRCCRISSPSSPSTTSCARAGRSASPAMTPRR